MIEYPAIDPVIVQIGGPFAIRWYGLLWVLGIAMSWILAWRRAQSPESSWDTRAVHDLAFFSLIGALLGARLGWCVLYDAPQTIADVASAFRLWEGGMSFHGGLVGVFVAAAYFAKCNQRRIADVLDFIVPVVGLGILCGRIGNFLNGELWGKQTEQPWGLLLDPATLHPQQALEAFRLCARFAVDPCQIQLHASQLYEGLLEGLLVFALLWLFTKSRPPRLAATGLFLLLYGLCRFGLEFIRVPDEQLGYLAFGWLTMGQMLTAPMILGGVVLICAAYIRPEPSGNYGSPPGGVDAGDGSPPEPVTSTQ